ncbi:MAG: class I SAM-dependent methyltransferase [Anaerolineaceae bacterium]|nr:class I SAM-dependent methyltransferase [Anaerolineaceae bacterium]
MQSPLEKWASGDTYEQFMGRWSRETAALFLDWLQPEVNSAWLDVGCGTGALTGVIASRAQANLLVGVDLSLDFVHYASRRIPDATFFNASALVLPVCAGQFDFVVSGLALNFLPQPAQALREWVRAARSGGVIAAYVWDYAGKMEFLRYFWDAAVELDSRARPQHEGQRFPTCQPDALNQLWQEAGLRHIRVQALDVVTIFNDFDSYWKPFTAGNFPAPQYLASLDDEGREHLHSLLLSALPIKEDGSIHLIARAWAVSGMS